MHVFFIAELQKQSTEEYKLWTAEQDKLETFKKCEEERINKEENEKWLRTELIAQVQWRQLQEKISKARFERAQQDLRIKKVCIYFHGKMLSFTTADRSFKFNKQAANISKLFVQQQTILTLTSLLLLKTKTEVEFWHCV